MLNRRIYIITALILSLGTQAIQATTPIRRFVLAAGANHGGPDRAILRYAVTDAQNFVRVMEEMGGVDPSDRILLADPSRPQFLRSLKELAERVEKSDATRTEVLLYYSGHADEHGLLLGEEDFPYRALRQALTVISADLHLTVLDACASGAITRLKGGQRQKAFMVDASSDMKGYAYIASSSENEAAQESDRISASFFTHYLVTGLRGAADATGDGKITLNEAYQFAYDETLNRTAGTQGGVQHPVRDIKLSGKGDVVMTDIRQTSAILHLDDSIGGRFFIRNAAQQLVAELYKPSGRSVELGLEPGKYNIHLEQQQSFLASNLQLEEGGRLSVTETDFAGVQREETASRGSETAASDFKESGWRVEGPQQVGVAIDDEHVLSAGVFVNHQDKPFKGLQLALLFNDALSTAGSQLALVGNLGRGSLDGFQGSLVANFAHGGVKAGQYASFVNYAGGPSPFQIAGFTNIAAGRLAYGQIAGFANIASAPVHLGQIAGFTNMTRGSVEGLQIAGFANLAKDVQGLQIAGMANMGRKVEGIQAGTINGAQRIEGIQAGVFNIAQEVEGLQIGLVNISQDIQGLPLGLVNYSHTGLFNLNTWVDETGLGHLTLISGSRNFYTSFSLGYQQNVNAINHANDPTLPPAQSIVNVDDLFAVGLGFGAQHQEGPWFVAADLNYYHLARDGSKLFEDSPENVLTRLRLLAGKQVSPLLSFFGGVSLNGLWIDKDVQLVRPAGKYDIELDGSYFSWPGFFAGLRFGR